MAQPQCPSPENKPVQQERCCGDCAGTKNARICLIKVLQRLSIEANARESKEPQR